MLIEMFGFSNAGLAIKSGYVSVLNPAKCLPFGGLVADELAMKWKGVAAADVGWPMSLRGVRRRIANDGYRLSAAPGRSKRPWAVA